MNHCIRYYKAFRDDVIEMSIEPYYDFFVKRTNRFNDPEYLILSILIKQLRPNNFSIDKSYSDNDVRIFECAKKYDYLFNNVIDYSDDLLLETLYNFIRDLDETYCCIKLVLNFDKDKDSTYLLFHDGDFLYLTIPKSIANEDYFKRCKDILYDCWFFRR